MPKIGLVDDREKSRESTKRLLESPLLKDKNSQWRVMDIPPFKNKTDYSKWILEDDISVLLIDEKLNESENSEFLGHDIVNYLRKKFKKLPIYGITAYEREEGLDSSLKNYDLIIRKSDLEDRRDDYLNLFLRSGEDFFNDNQEKMQELSKLSTKVARGNFTKEDLDKLKLLQSYLEIPHSNEGIENKSVWLKDLENSVEEFSKVINEIKDNCK